MKIAILDNESGRVIVAKVPAYLEQANASSDDIAEAILAVLDIRGAEYMIGNFSFKVDVAVLNEGPNNFSGDKTCRLEEFVPDFKTAVLEVLTDIQD